jgi:hypothetical protein
MVNAQWVTPAVLGLLLPVFVVNNDLYSEVYSEAGSRPDRLAQAPPAGLRPPGSDYCCTCNHLCQQGY